MSTPINVTNLTNITAELTTVTPELARQWLGQNLHNRTLRSAKIHAYARDMKAGNWQITGEAIKFGTDGELKDGQHRCHAVIEADTAVPMLVVRGIRPEAQSVMDTGAKRTSSDALKLQGHTNTNLLAAAARIAINYQADNFTDTRNLGKEVTHTEVFDFIDANVDLIDAVSTASSISSSVDITPSVLAIAIWKTAAIDADASAEFFSRLANNQTAGSGDPINTLIKATRSRRRSGIRINQAEQLSMVFRAWNAWRSGRSLTQIKTKVNGEVIAIPEPK